MAKFRPGWQNSIFFHYPAVVSVSSNWALKRMSKNKWIESPVKVVITLLLPSWMMGMTRKRWRRQWRRREEKSEGAVQVFIKHYILLFKAKSPSQRHTRTHTVMQWHCKLACLQPLWAYYVNACIFFCPPWTFLMCSQFSVFTLVNIQSNNNW